MVSSTNAWGCRLGCALPWPYLSPVITGARVGPLVVVMARGLMSGGRGWVRVWGGSECQLLAGSCPPVAPVVNGTGARGSIAPHSSPPLLIKCSGFAWHTWRHTKINTDERRHMQHKTGSGLENFSETCIIHVDTTVIIPLFMSNPFTCSLNS